MKRNTASCVVTLALLSVTLPASTIAQKIRDDIRIEILRAEDELRYDKGLEDLMNSSNPVLLRRAALAAGRIGDEDAIPALGKLLINSGNPEVRQMAAFALGEIESIKGSESLLLILKKLNTNQKVRARAIEAAGKIVAANAKAEAAKFLTEAILSNLDYEAGRGSKQGREVILLGLTAVLRSKPANADDRLIPFLQNSDWRIRADTLNSLSRLDSKKANDEARQLLGNDKHPVVRANAARVLGAGDDKAAVGMLLNSAVRDEDIRVRVNAIRALGSLGAAPDASLLLERAEILSAAFSESKDANPPIKNELLTLVTAVGTILKNSENARAVKLFQQIRINDKFRSPETEIAFAIAAPESYLSTDTFQRNSLNFNDLNSKYGWKSSNNLIQGLSEIAKLDDGPISVRAKAEAILIRSIALADDADSEVILAFPALLTTMARFHSDEKKPPPIPEGVEAFDQEKLVEDFLRRYVVFRNEESFKQPRKIVGDRVEPGHFDPFIRAAAGSGLAARKSSTEIIKSLKLGFREALDNDKRYDDAQLAILSALVKLDKVAAKDSLDLALNHYAFLIRRQAANLIKQNDMEKDFPNLKERVGMVKPFDPETGSKLGQTTNTEQDYRRALSRKNGESTAILTTEKGKFRIDFFPEEAPLTVDNFIKLANSGYFNGIEIHRVVPNFVMQDGDPRGDGNGGPGWQIRCEINQIPYERGMVGMALSGKDTGGSQWFVTHSPQPHLDGGYTVFGKVNEEGMKIVDNLVRGDKILNVRIVESFKASRRAVLSGT